MKRLAVVLLFALMALPACQSLDEREKDALTTSIAVAERFEAEIQKVGVYDTNGNLTGFDFKKDDGPDGQVNFEPGHLLEYLRSNARDWRVWGYKLGVVSEEEWLKIRESR